VLSVKRVYFQDSFARLVSDKNNPASFLFEGSGIII
jgi:hypothetical protein